jgi:hypothetical protein
MQKKVDRLCGLVVRAPDYRTGIYCVSCEVRTEFIYVMQKKVDHLCGLVVRFPDNRTEIYCVSCEVRTEFIYVTYVEESRPPLWSSGQSSWLQIQRSGFDFRRYQIFWEVVELERGSFNLVSAIEKLLGRKSSGSGLYNREYGRRVPSTWNSLSAKIDTNFSDNWRSFGRHSSLADSGQGV